MKKYSIHTALLALFLLLLSAGMFSQTYTNLPYFEGFEDAVSNSEWHLNVVDPATSTVLPCRWVVSGAERYFGDSCLLITADADGATYPASTASVVAWREITLPVGMYSLSFMWRAEGEFNKDGLSVCWLPASRNIYSGISGSVVTTPLDFDGYRQLSGHSVWYQSSTTIRSMGTPMKLVFVWDNNMDAVRLPSACIDDIQIVSSKIPCDEPSNITHTLKNSKITLFWKSSVRDHEVICRPYGSAHTDTVKVSGAAQAEIQVAVPGVYDFYIRSFCPEGDTTRWVPYRNVYISSQVSGCIDYADFKNPDVAKCTYGYNRNEGGVTPYDSIGYIDYGADSWRSRHTLYFMPGQTDSLTGGGLKTIADGETASVRLGNSDINAEAESITYTYNIDNNDTTKILIVKYAVVLQDPGHRPATEQPAFKLDILDENGVNLDSLCGYAEFYAKPDPLWHDYPFGAVIRWKEWTTIGLNVSEYAGSTIRIRFTSYDCRAGGHFGYAYFSIGCAEAKIEGITCGAEASTHVEAPDGFKYRWYRKNAPETTVAETRVLDIDPKDADIYQCDVIFAENDGCYFTLEANLLPHLPKAVPAPVWAPQGCSNRLHLRNASGVESEGVMTGEHVTFNEWTVTDLAINRVVYQGNDEQKVVGLPDEGGHYSILLNVGIQNNVCVDDSLIADFFVPAIGNRDSIIYDTICRNQVSIFNGRPIRESGTYLDTVPTYAGCDSVITFKLEVVDFFTREVLDTISEGEEYHFYDNSYREERTYRKTVYSDSPDVCDSVIILHLDVDTPTVVQCLRVTFDTLPVICADDKAFAIPFTVDSGSFSSYSLDFDEHSETYFFDMELVEADNIEIALPDSVRPDIYGVDVILHDSSACPPVIRHYDFEVRYPADIMQQKWNDVIALYDQGYGANFGYRYSSHQWYRNGDPIAGADRPYIYVGADGSQFTPGDEITVVLVREGETRRIMSCPYIVTAHTDIAAYPSLPALKVRVASKVGLPATAGEYSIAYWYSSTGQFVGAGHIDASDGSVTVPSVSGMYLLYIIPQQTDRLLPVTIKVLVTP